MKRTPNTTAEWIAIFLVPGISLLHIALHIFGGWDFSMLLSLTGFLYAAAFLMNWKFYTFVLAIWAVLQLVVVKFTVNGNLVDFSQVISAGFGMGFNLRSGGYFYLGLGFAGFFYVPLALKVRLDGIMGKEITLRSFKADSFLAEILPAKAKIMKRITAGDEEVFFLVEHFEKAPIQYALIQGKESPVIKTGEKQIVKYYVVDDPTPILMTKRADLKQLKSAAWAVVE